MYPVATRNRRSADRRQYKNHDYDNIIDNGQRNETGRGKNQ